MDPDPETSEPINPDEPIDLGEQMASVQNALNAAKAAFLDAGRSYDSSGAQDATINRLEQVYDPENNRA